jgi:hypothetical protein
MKRRKEDAMESANKKLPLRVCDIEIRFDSERVLNFRYVNIA